MRYLLNSAVITAPGTYEYSLIPKEQAQDWLVSEFPVENSIGYDETIQAFNLMFGMGFVTNRKNIRMEAGDEAIVFRLTGRVSDWQGKGKMGLDFVLENCEIGLLMRTK